MTKRLSAHGRAVVLCVWLAALSYSQAALAGVPSLSEAIRAYDFEAMGWCVLVSIVGGFGRTVLTLLSQDVLVLSVLRETWRDLLIAGLAGVVAFMVLYAVQSMGVTIPVPVLVLVLATCGWARMGFFVWAEKSAKTVADRGAQWAADKISKPDPYGKRYSADTWRDPRPDAIPDAPRVDAPEEEPK